MRKIIRQKKGISVVIGYVLLITISLSLSMLVYVWMKRQAPVTTIECPDTLSLMVQNYACNNGLLNITLKNNGLYNIRGAIIKVSNSSMVPIYPLSFKESIPKDKVKNMSNIEYRFIEDLKASGNEVTTLIFNYSRYNLITKINIIPLYYSGDEEIVCSYQEINQDLNQCN